MRKRELERVRARASGPQWRELLGPFLFRARTPFLGHVNTLGRECCARLPASGNRGDWVGTRPLTTLRLSSSLALSGGSTLYRDGHT